MVVLINGKPKLFANNLIYKKSKDHFKNLSKRPSHVTIEYNEKVNQSGPDNTNTKTDLEKDRLKIQVKNKNTDHMIIYLNSKFTPKTASTIGSSIDHNPVKWKKKKNTNCFESSSSYYNEKYSSTEIYSTDEKHCFDYRKSRKKKSMYTKNNAPSSTNITEQIKNPQGNLNDAILELLNLYPCCFGTIDNIKNLPCKSFYIYKRIFNSTLDADVLNNVFNCWGWCEVQDKCKKERLCKPLMTSMPENYRIQEWLNQEYSMLKDDIRQSKYCPKLDGPLSADVLNARKYILTCISDLLEQKQLLDGEDLFFDIDKSDGPSNIKKNSNDCYKISEDKKDNILEMLKHTDIHKNENNRNRVSTTTYLCCENKKKTIPPESGIMLEKKSPKQMKLQSTTNLQRTIETNEVKTCTSPQENKMSTDNTTSRNCNISNSKREFRYSGSPCTLQSRSIVEFLEKNDPKTLIKEENVDTIKEQVMEETEGNSVTKRPEKIRFAVVRISDYKQYTIFEVMKSLKQKPKHCPDVTEDIFFIQKNLIKLPL